MKRRHHRPVPVILGALAATLIILSAGSSALAQPPLTTEREQTMKTERDKRTSGPDLNFRSPIIYSPTTRARMLRLATAEEIRKDAERMRYFNSEMMRSVSPGAALDYESISKSAAEIKKRAVRLMLNLGLPRTKKAENSQKGEAEFNDREMAASLTKLDGLIKGLSANPLLTNRNVIDAGQAASAARDLEDIIVLSDQIRKSAKKLNQAARKSH